MKRGTRFMLVDETGQPLSPHVADALVSLVPRFQREFPLIRDQSLLTDFLEEAGRRIVKRETRSGPIEHLHGYAWVALRSIGRSWQRRGSSRLSLNTLTSEASASALSAIAVSHDGPEQIERAILRRQVHALMTREERLVCIRKEMGFSSREIARRWGTSAGAIDTLLSRTRARLRKLLGVHTRDAGQDDQIDKSVEERPDSRPHRGPACGKLDDE